jgi:hypothetical protein
VELGLLRQQVLVAVRKYFLLALLALTGISIRGSVAIRISLDSRGGEWAFFKAGNGG